MRPYELYKLAALNADVTLYDHQREGVDKLLANDGRMLFAHGVGTGKTLTSIAGIEKLREQGKAHVTLAVTPAALRDNYIDNGVHQFTDQHAVRLGSRGERGSVHIGSKNIPKGSYYVVSNEMFRKDPTTYLKKLNPDTLVWDEMHKGRDNQTANYQAMMTARPYVRNFIGLTGTPLMNHPRDIVPQLDIVTNGQHGLGVAEKPNGFKKSSPQSFDKRFIEKDIKHHGPLGWLGIGPKSTEEHLKNTDVLRAELSRHVHYVPTEDVAKNMPEKRLHDVEVEMSPHQQKLYNFALDKVDPVTRFMIRNNLPVGSKEALHIFSMITQARQASNALHPLDSKKTPLDSATETPKAKRVIDDVVSHLDEHPSHKAIVYTNLVHGGIDEIESGLKARGIEPGKFIGSGYQKKQERDQHVNDYLSGKKRVMLINTAGTEGLNLPGTTAHFTLDPHFNPSVMEQAEARGIRSGSPVKAVDVYRYKSVIPRPLGIPFLPRETGTDEWIQGIADRKEKLNREMLDLMRPKEKAAAMTRPYDLYQAMLKEAAAQGDDSTQERLKQLAVYGASGAAGVAVQKPVKRMVVQHALLPQMQEEANRTMQPHEEAAIKQHMEAQIHGPVQYHDSDPLGSKTLHADDVKLLKTLSENVEGMEEGFRQKGLDVATFKDDHHQVWAAKGKSPAILAHELGHRMDNGQVKLLNYARPLSEPSKFIGAFAPNVGVAAAATALHAPTLYEEARASFNAYHALKAVHGEEAAARSVRPLLAAYGTYAADAASPMVGYATSHGLRKTIDEVGKHFSEKKASLGELALRALGV